jgi:peptide/nickel transport system ATP-binding protein/oligopeptide transport system ATP-binding protein
MENLLQVRDLATHFYTQDGIVKAVDGVSYEVARGETVALVGESGCGKSVSAHSILRLIPDPPGRIVQGEILFNGINLLELPKKDLRKIRGTKISMIFQEPLTSLNPVLTIGRQLTEALEHHQKMTFRQASEEAIKLLNQVGISQPERRLKDYPHQFSGGMRQRVMIAMAISCRPELIIADEPTTAIDVTVQAQLLELIRGLTRKLGTSLILITHNLGIVARYAERVYVMYAGRIVECGRAEDMFHRPNHPYTIGLLTSLPRLDEPRKTRLVPVAGHPPDLLSPPEGCSFWPRCHYQRDLCREGRPDLIQTTPGHFVACHYAKDGAMPWQTKK